LFSLFAAPPEKDLDWSEHGVEGSYRFLTKIARLTAEVGPGTHGRDPGVQWVEATIDPQAARKLRALVHDTIFRVTRDIGERMRFNTAISAVMELVNGVQEYRGALAGKSDQMARFGVATAIRLLFPFVPHVTCEMWERMGHGDALYREPWPEWDDTARIRDTVEVAIQVNGKVRSRIVVPADVDRAELEQLALADDKVSKELGGKAPRNVVVVPGRLVNVVA
jgi:leucyl-tRNA synthetase